MRKLRLWEVKCPTQSHSGHKWQSWGSLDQNIVIFPQCYCESLLWLIMCSLLLGKESFFLDSAECIDCTSFYFLEKISLFIWEGLEQREKNPNRLPAERRDERLHLTTPAQSKSSMFNWQYHRGTAVTVVIKDSSRGMPGWLSRLPLAWILHWAGSREPACGYPCLSSLSLWQTNQ